MTAKIYVIYISRVDSETGRETGFKVDSNTIFWQIVENYVDKGLTPRNNDETIRKYRSVIKKPESQCKEKKAEARGKGEISLTIGRILVYKFITAYLGAVSFWLSP